MAIKLNGSTSGSVALDAPADTSPSGTDVTLTLPTSAGSSGQYLQTNGSGTLSWQTVSASNLTMMTAVSASGTSVDFTSIPTDARKITVSLRQVSTNGSADFRVQLGVSGSPITTNYYYSKSIIQHNTVTYTLAANPGSGFEDYAQASGCVRHGLITFQYIDANTWAANWVFGRTDVGATHSGGGYVNVGGTVDMVRLTTSNGTDTFDSGTFGLSYEVA